MKKNSMVFVSVMCSALAIHLGVWGMEQESPKNEFQQAEDQNGLAIKPSQFPNLFKYSKTLTHLQEEATINTDGVSLPNNFFASQYDIKQFEQLLTYAVQDQLPSSLSQQPSSSILVFLKLYTYFDIQLPEDKGTILYDALRYSSISKEAIENIANNVNKPIEQLTNQDIIAVFGLPENYVYDIFRQYAVKNNYDLYTLYKTLPGHRGFINSVAYSPDGKQLASGSQDATIKIWDASSGQVINTLNGYTNNVLSVAYSPNSTQIASSSTDNIIKIWDTNSGKLINTLNKHTDFVRSVAYSSNGTQIASASDDRTIKIWNANTGDLLLTLESHQGWINSVAYSPNSTQLASGSGDSTIKIWDASSGKVINTLTGHKDFVWSVAWSPDGKQLASGSGDSTIKIWDATSGKVINTLSGHKSWVRSVAWSPDGTKVASGSGDKTIKIWDVTSGQVINTLQGHTENVVSVAWSPDGTKVASGSGDKTIKLWQLKSLAQLAKEIYKRNRTVEQVIAEEQGS